MVEGGEVVATFRVMRHGQHKARARRSVAGASAAARDVTTDEIARKRDECDATRIDDESLARG